MKRAIALPALMLVANIVYATEAGFSNYIPGFYGDLALAVEPPEGVSFRNDLYFYSGDGGGSVRSGQVEIDADVTLVYDYASIFYNPGIEIFSSRVVFGIVPTIGYVDIDTNVLGAGGDPVRAEDDTLGIGDVTLAANFYWSEDKWNFLWGNFVVMPVGAYDVDNLANAGLNIWTFETDFMTTYFDDEKGRDYSGVVGYSYNTKNDDTDYKSGDEFHIDVVLNQFLSDSFAIGINGFFYRQLSGDSGSGAVLGDFKGEAAGIGPAIYWIRNISDTEVAFIVKWLHEFGVKNRFEGDHAFASFALSF